MDNITAQVSDFLGRDLFVVKGMHVTVGLVALVVLAFYVWKHR